MVKATYESVINMIREVELKNFSGYGSQKLPSSFDDTISKLIKVFIELEPKERTKIYGSVEKTFLFLAFSERMAILGVRERSQNRLFEGLIAHAIEDFSYDFRENFLILSLLHHSALKLDLEPKDLFERAAKYASSKAANYLLAFIKKPGGIRSMGYCEVITEEGFTYRRNW